MNHHTNTTEGGGDAALDARREALIAKIAQLAEEDLELCMRLCEALLRLGDDNATDGWVRQTLAKLADTEAPG